MELEKFEEVYQVLEAQKEKDETAAELYADVKEFAYKYATMLKKELAVTAISDILDGRGMGR